MLKRTPLLIFKNYNVGFIIVKSFFEKGSIFGGFGQTFTLATLLPVDEATIIATLDALDVPDPFKVLMCAGVYKSVSNGVRTYDVINACCGVLITDGGRSAEAKNKFAGSLAVQACHLPIIGATDCGATMTWNESTGAIALVPAVSGGNG